MDLWPGSMLGSRYANNNRKLAAAQWKFLLYQPYVDLAFVLAEILLLFLKLLTSFNLQSLAGR
jgi:hypothetical protein